jgi:DNA-binding winged helix-turn-helix (wHTH) protein
MQGDFRLGDWHVEPALGRASRDGQAVHLRAKVMDLLVCLARRPGDVISKDELLAEVWKTEFVTESALTRVITELRQAFGDDADHPRIIETIPKRGYRLIAPVVRISDVAQPPEASHVASAVRADRGARIGWTRTALVLGVCLALGAPAAWLATTQRTAAPILTERDSVLLADFANHTTIRRSIECSAPRSRSSLRSRRFSILCPRTESGRRFDKWGSHRRRR